MTHKNLNLMKYLFFISPIISCFGFNSLFYVYSYIKKRIENKNKDFIFAMKNGIVILFSLFYSIIVVIISKLIVYLEIKRILEIKIRKFLVVYLFF